ncbi:uncharacterized protein LOC143299514 [Babylonia areolata]|uniref:uncharacterized protein LOC143299514 n=1 Tax=Babylonia areolata TaxID=304850 RepID=UPI003FD2172D
MLHIKPSLVRGFHGLVVLWIPFFTYHVSEAYLCDDTDVSVRYRSTTEGTRTRCCKVEHYINRKETRTFYCEGGCCGDKDDEYCCHYINKEALPYVIGFSIFGVVLVVTVAIILFCVLRKGCKLYKQFEEHKKLFTEAYSARTLEELMEVRENSVMQPPGTIVHPLASDEDYEGSRRRGPDAFCVEDAPSGYGSGEGFHPSSQLPPSYESVTK